MTSIEQAIKFSIEGGYKGIEDGEWKIEYGDLILFRPKDGAIRSRLDKNFILLDKNFWICLGKQQGWKIQEIISGTGDSISVEQVGTDWLEIWHSFIDALSRDETPEQFFEGLLDNK